jgi:hypothetical protein
LKRSKNSLLNLESELNEADLIDLLSDANTTSEDADDDNQENEDLNKASSSSSNSKALREHFDMLAKGADFFREIDPSPDLAQKFHREHTQLIKNLYEELYKKLINNQKQPLIKRKLHRLME